MGNESNSADEKSDPEPEGEEAEGQKKEAKESYAQTIYSKILEKAKIGAFAGESIITLNEVNLAVPRGKYTIDFYQKNLRFHGQTYNFVIEYKNITKGFILPMENEAQVSIIFQLHKDRPIYQGQTLYRYIVVQVKKDIEVDIKTRVKNKDVEKYPNLSQIKEEYKGALFQVLLDIIRCMASITLIAPDTRDFKSKTGQSCVKCGNKALTGWLYFLKKSLIFIPKPVIYFKSEEISKVRFTRLGTNNKQFDMKVELSDKKAVEFIGLERNELDNVLEFFKARNVRLEMEEEVKKIQPEMGGDDDEEDDEDFSAHSGESDDDESFDED